MIKLATVGLTATMKMMIRLRVKKLPMAIGWLLMSMSPAIEDDDKDLDLSGLLELQAD